MENNNILSDEVPSWFLQAGFVTGAMTLIFFMVLVIASLFGNNIPRDTRFLVNVVLSLGIGLSTTFLGGHALAEGDIPLPFNFTPISFSLSGGLATILIFLVLGSRLYPSKADNEFRIVHDEAFANLKAQRNIETLTHAINSLPSEKVWNILQNPPSELDKFTLSAIEARLGNTRISAAEKMLGGAENDAIAKAILKMILVLISNRSEENLAKWEAAIVAKQ